MSGAEIPVAASLLADTAPAAAGVAGMASAAPGIAGLFGPAAGTLSTSLLAAPTAAAAAPLGMVTAAPGIAGLFGVGSNVASLAPNAKAMTQMGMSMLDKAMQPTKPNPALTQRPPSMQQQQPQSLPAPAMNRPAIGSPMGMAMGPTGATSGVQDILRRLGMNT